MASSLLADSGHDKLKALVVDDEKNIRTTLSLCLEQMGCKVTAAPSAESALAALTQQPYDLAFLDLRLADASGLDLVPKLLAEDPNLFVIVVTAYATIDTAVEAIRRGAKDYIPKPFTPAQIEHVVKQVAERRELTSRIASLEEQLRATVPDVELQTQSPKMHVVFDTALRAAKSEAAIMLRGESGTGKGVLARMIHIHSPRADRPFVVVNCPTLSEELLASELFGHARGAFTGAVRDQAGRVEAAQGGTLFLDEIGEISPALQAKLLRFLQEKQFERLGETRTRTADVRVIAATNRNLERDVQEGRFREDLFYRLNVVEIFLPPLRERPEDILPLARRFLEFFSRAARRSTPELSQAAEQALVSYSWPGNVRELANAIERAMILWPAQVIQPEGLPEPIAAHRHVGSRLGGDFTLEQIEREHITRVVSRTETLEEAAAILGIDSSTLWRKRKKYEE
jgi:NtrC-family two-component system response regulator AlgB